MNESWDGWESKRDSAQGGRRNAPINQIDIEGEIIRLSNELEEETEAFETLSVDHARKEAEFKKLWFGSYLNAEGSIKERESFAGYRHADMYLESQVAEALVKAKRERLHSLRTRLDSLRTLAANVRTQVQS